MLAKIGATPQPWAFHSSKTPIIFCKVPVEKLNTKGGLDNRILVCSEASASLYKESSFSKELSKCRTFRWFSLKKIYVEPPRKLFLHFKDGEIICFHERAQDIAKILASYVLDILSERDKPVISLKGFTYEMHKPSQIRSLMRFRARMFGLGKQPPAPVLISLNTFLASKSNELDIEEITTDVELIDNVLFAINVESNIKRLIIPKCEEASLWEPISRMIANNNYVTSISISDRYNNDFIKLKDALEYNKNCAIREIELVDSKFPVTAVNELAEVLSKMKLTSLFLNGCFGKAPPDAFMEALYNSHALDTVTQLALIDINHLNLNVLSPYLGKLNSLILKNCKEDVSTLIDAISASNIKLTKIDLSENNLLEKVTEGTDFAGAEIIILDDTTFTPESLSSVIKAAGKTKRAISLSLSRADFNNNDDWAEFFRQTKKLSHLKIGEFVWNENPTPPRLFKFFSKNHSITSVSLGGCLIRDQEQQAQFIKWISKASKLQNLSFVPSGGKMLSSEGLNALIKGISANRSLISVNLENIEIKPKQSKELTLALMSNRVISTLIIRNTNLLMPEAWEGMFKQLSKRGRPISIPFPADECAQMLAMNKLMPEKIDRLKKMHRYLIQGNKNIEIPESCLKYQEEGKKDPKSPKSGSRLDRLAADAEGEESTMRIDLPDPRTVGFTGVVTPPMPEPEVVFDQFQLIGILRRLNYR